MKGINPTHNPYADAVVTPLRGAQPAPQVAEKSAGQQGEQAPARLQISQEARELASAQGPQRAEEIAALQAQVEQGTLTMDARAIAQKLLDTIG